MINDKYIGTKSNKFRRIPYIIEYLMKVIDCQEIRRLCRYYTLDPLADEALDYNGVLVKQPDLVDSLENKVIRDKVSKGAEEQILISETFSNTIVNYNRMQICVYPYEITFSERASRYGTSTFGYMTFHIDIIYTFSIHSVILVVEHKVCIDFLDFSCFKHKFHSSIPTFLRFCNDFVDVVCKYILEVGHTFFKNFLCYSLYCFFINHPFSAV